MTSSVPSFAAAALLFAAAVAAPQQAAPDTPEEIVRRILELHQEIEGLLARLPVELRAEVRRRLAEESEAGERSEQGSADESSAGSASDIGTVDQVASTAASTAPTAEPPVSAPEPAGRESRPAVPTSGSVAPPILGGDRPSTAAARSRQSPFGAASAAGTAPGTPAAESAPSPPTPRCNTLLAFDGDGDGSVTAADRLWRHLYLWVDANADGVLGEREVRHLYDHDVRAVDVELRHYIDKRALSADVRVGPRVIRLELVSSHRRSEEAILVADATGLARSGELELLSPDGTQLEGYQPFAPGVKLRGPTGTVAIDCP